MHPGAEELKQVISSGQAVAVVGTGLSVSSTNRHPSASWLGLIKSTIEILKAKLPSDKLPTLTAAEGLVDAATSSQSASNLLIAADILGGMVKDIGSQAEADWLRETVGSLEVVDSAWPQAVVNLGIPVLTTNYDTLIEQATNLDSVAWTDTVGVQENLGSARARPKIIHLHGVWNDRESVIFTNSDYTRLKLNPGIQDLLKSVLAARRLVYIGYGSGLDDPTFGRLLEWHRNTFSGTSLKHFRLCRESELADLERLHADDTIVPISYGNDYGDLPKFVNNLTNDNGKPVAKLLAIAREALVEQIHQNLVGVSTPSLNSSLASQGVIPEPIFPPILLPLPHAEFVRMQMASDETKYERLNPVEVANQPGITLVAADEQDGLSTALRWLLLERAKSEPGQIPLLIDFRFANGNTPLESQLKVQASTIGVIPSKKNELPSVLPGIDNFSSRKRRLLNRAVSEIASGKLGGQVFLGCRTGEEAEIVRTLSEKGIGVHIVYVGRLGTGDIRRLVDAQLAGDAEGTADAVIKALRQQNMPTNPVTVSRIAHVISSGVEIRANTSPTHVLREYLDLLLGSGQDDRFELDAESRDVLLQEIALQFLRSDRESLITSRVLETLEDFIERVLWTDDPRDILDGLIDRGVLALDGGYIRFAQETYLYYFLARAAMTQEQKTPGHGLDSLGLLKDSLRFAPIIRHYAALLRRDSALLTRVGYILDDAGLTGAVSPGAAFSRRFRRPDPEEVSSLEEHVPQAPMQRSLQPGSENPYDVNDYFAANRESPESGDLPFPLQPYENGSAFIKKTYALDLASSIVRESTLVEDQDLKSSVLRQVLVGWGALIDFMVEDEETQAALQELTAQIVEALDLDDEERDQFVERFGEFFPPTFAMSGVSSSLASRKLLRTVEHLLTIPEGKNDVLLTTVAAMLLVDLRAPGWVTTVSKILNRTSDLYLVNKFLYEHLVANYYRGGLPPQEDKRLLELIGDLFAAQFSVKENARGAQLKSVAMQTISQRRSTHQFRLPGEDPVLSGEIES